jgi:hypothetical protein
MPLIILSKQYWKMLKKKDNRVRETKHHLCKEIKTSIIASLNGIILLLLVQWRRSFKELFQ